MSNSLLSSPLFGVALTLFVFQLAALVYRRFQYTILNPAVVAIGVIMILLLHCHIPYADYARGGDMILFLLGPGVVALGVPLYQRRSEIMARFVPIVVGITVGSVTSIVTAAGIVLFLNGGKQLALTMAPKSVTTPIAISIASKIGGITPLTAAVVVVTGCLGAVVGPAFCRLLGIKDYPSMGLAMGAAAHGFGTGRMLEIDLLGGAFAGLAIGINGMITALIMPLFVLLLQ